VITVAVRWYLRYGLSYRDVEELLAERGIGVDHVTVYRWVQRFTPRFADAARLCRHAAGDRWFDGETYVEVAGRWRIVLSWCCDDQGIADGAVSVITAVPYGGVLTGHTGWLRAGWTDGSTSMRPPCVLGQPDRPRRGSDHAADPDRRGQLRAQTA